LIVRTVQFGPAIHYFQVYVVAIEPYLSSCVDQMHEQLAGKGAVPASWEGTRKCLLPISQYPNYIKLPNRLCHTQGRPRKRIVPGSQRSPILLPPTRN